MKTIVNIRVEVETPDTDDVDADVAAVEETMAKLCDIINASGLVSDVPEWEAEDA